MFRTTMPRKVTFSTCPLVATPLETACKAIVVIPVRNEENRILSCLSAFKQQQGIRSDQFEIILLLNNCTDGSEAMARTFADRNPELTIHLVSRQLTPSQSNIGTVRRLLMDEACKRFSMFGLTSGAILTTDADTAVDSQWIAQNLAELNRGADAVGGRISLDCREMRNLTSPVRQQYWWNLAHGLLRARLESELDPVPWDPWPRHHQNFCGSLAITASMYFEAGGVPDVTNLEDVAFCESILNVGGKIRHSPLVRVRTSARLQGRVGVGLSTHLCGFETTRVAMVESVDLAIQKFRACRELRESDASPSELELECKCIDECWSGPRQMPIDKAVAKLRILIHGSKSSIISHANVMKL